MTAKFEDTRTYAGPKQRIFRACIDAMQLSGFKLTESEQQSGSINATSFDSQYSSRPDSGFFEEVGLIVADLTGATSKFQERISLTVGDDGSVHAISVSEPATVRLDHGRNMQHVLRLWAALDATLGHEGMPARIATDNGVTTAGDTVPIQDMDPRRESSEKPSGAARYGDSATVAVGRVLSAHAFISYVREDSVEVDALQRSLEAAGVPVWRDTSDLWPGDDWRLRISDAIKRDALIFIACFSRHSAAREESYQNEELALAVDQLRLRRPGVPWLFPVRFDDCAIPYYELGAGRTLASFQRADIFGDRRNEATARLVKAILRILPPGKGVRAPRASRKSEQSRRPKDRASSHGATGRETRQRAALLPERDNEQAEMPADGRVVIDGSDRWAMLWKPDHPVSDRVELGRNNETVQAMTTLADGRLATCRSDGRVVVWDPDHKGPGIAVELGRHIGPARAAANLANGRLITAGDDRRVLIWDPANPAVRPAKLHRADARVTTLATLSDGRIVVGRLDGRVLVYVPSSSGSRPVELGLHNSMVRTMTVLSDGRVATAGDDAQVLIWDPSHPDANRVAALFCDDMVFSIGALLDGRLVICGGLDKRVLIWNPSQPGIGYVTELGRHRDKAWSVTVLPDGRVASGGKYDRVLIWNPNRPGTPDIQLNCSVARLATANLRHIGPCLVISHPGGGFSLWKLTE